MARRIPCQDRTKTLFENGASVIALSDGAGSAALSQYGAETVVDTVAELFSGEFDALFGEPDGRKAKARILDALLSALRERSVKLACDLKDLAATLLAVAVKDDRFLMVHLGDGVVGYLRGETLAVASAPANGEFANETWFVTSGDALGRMTLFKGAVGDIGGFALMSDGTEASLYDKRAGALSPAVRKLMQRNALLNGQKMQTQLTHVFEDLIRTRTRDDCSIALLSRVGDGIKPAKALESKEKYRLYNLTPGRGAGKRSLRYDCILEHLGEKPMSCACLARKLRLKPKYTKRRLQQLCAAGLVCRKGDFYFSEALCPAGE